MDAESMDGVRRPNIVDNNKDLRPSSSLAIASRSSSIDDDAPEA
jgi:hypothetical protein